MVKYYGGGCKSSKYNIEKEYTIEGLLGEGGFGKVYRVKNRIGETFAMKVIRQKTRHTRLIQNEIKFMKLLNHHFVLKFYQELPIQISQPILADIPKNAPVLEKIKYAKGPNAQSRLIDNTLRHMPEVTEFKFIIEYCQGGDLHDYIDLYYHLLTDDSYRIIMYQILNGMKFLHDAGIIHRDLKLDNILLKNHESIDCLKIADFGLAQYYNVENCCADYAGTPTYIAPEVFSANDDPNDSKHKYNEKCDMWSIGVILFMIYFKQEPFDNTYLKKNRKKIKNLDNYLTEHFRIDRHSRLLNQIPTDVSIILRGLLSFYPGDRWSCSHCLTSDFFKDYDRSVHSDCLTQFVEDNADCEPKQESTQDS